MRIISLRKFRDAIADIEEPVEVARRDSDGSIQIIGTWTPGVVRAQGPWDGLLRSVAATIAEDERFDDVPVRTAAQPFSSRPFQPVPKRR